MEQVKAIKMVIARYKADAAALVRREEDLMRQIEMIENLIPTVTIWYMSIAVQATDMMIPQREVEEAREKLEHLKSSLKEYQQSIVMIREEESIVNKRIEELEMFLGDEAYQYRPTYNVIDSDMPRSERPGSSGITYEKETEDFKVEGFESQRENFEELARAEATNLKQYASVHSVNKDKSVYSVNKDTSVYSVNKDTSVHSVNKDTSVQSANKDTSVHSVNKDTSVQSVNKDILVHSVNKDTSVHSVNKDTSVYSVNKDTSVYSVNKDTSVHSVNKDTSVSTNICNNATQKPEKLDILRNSLQGADIAHEKGDDLQTEGLEDQRVKSEGLSQAEDTDWKKVCEDLSYQVSKLGENLENSSQQLRESESYVKRLEEDCSKLEKELQAKIQLLKNRTHTYKEQEQCSQKDLENEEALWAMHEALAKTRSMKEELTLSTNLSTMGEGEGITPAYMQLAHWRFALKLPEYQGDRELKEKLINGIKQGNMAPYYKEVCADLGWEFDSKLYDEMAAANVKRLEELEKDHENNVMDEEDQSQLCGVWQSKLDYLCSIGDRENASTLANSKVDDKTVPKSHRIDAVFSLFRISFFHGCNIKGMSTAIEKATELIEGISGGDWSARNKLKAYEGVWSLAIRDFTRAAHLFVDVVPTFESYELADFGTIIRYTVLSCMIALPRCDLRKKLMLHGVMAQALHSQYQDLREYFVSLYDGRYSDFLVCLARIEVEMKRDPLLHPHYRHYVQEMRLRAYKQILQAYRSLSLDYMAQSFGVTSEFIEREVARFAAAGRLQCKIDSVAGTVITSAHLDDSVRSKEAPEASLDRNILYQTTVKRGDILLNRLKKLARVMDF